ncbi:unnamed protein product [Merluccius merluccius]
MVGFGSVFSAHGLEKQPASALECSAGGYSAHSRWFQGRCLAPQHSRRWREAARQPKLDSSLPASAYTLCKAGGPSWARRKSLPSTRPWCLPEASMAG